MKTRITSLIAILTIVFSIPGMAGQRIQVEAVNNDISYYLDLKAIASIFGDSRDLGDFEQRINDYDSRISNLDLNNDGDVDYLRVIETSENNTHLVVIQAILERDVYQDVATIVVERDRYRRSYVQVIGDPYIYGANYIIEPVFYRTPRIYSWFWSTNYSRWNSPYYWGYYPRYYNHCRPLEINIYLSHVNGYVNYNHYYRYSNSWHSDYAYRMHSSISRNDYSNRYPERSYNKRNTNFNNRYEMDKSRNSSYIKSEGRGENSSRGTGSRRSSNDDVYNRSSRTVSDSRTNTGTRSESMSRASTSRTNTRTESANSTSLPASSGRSVYSTRENRQVNAENRGAESKVITQRSSAGTINSNANVRSTRQAIEANRTESHRTESHRTESPKVERSNSSPKQSAVAPSSHNEPTRSTGTSTVSRRSSNESKRGEASGGRR